VPPGLWGKKTALQRSKTVVGFEKKKNCAAVVGGENLWHSLTAPKIRPTDQVLWTAPKWGGKRKIKKKKKTESPPWGGWDKQMLKQQT